MTEQDIKKMINSIFYNSGILTVDGHEIKYQGITLINPKTKNTYKSEEIISELLGVIDYKKINSINEGDLQNITKLFLDLQMSITKLYLTYNE